MYSQHYIAWLQGMSINDQPVKPCRTDFVFALALTIGTVSFRWSCFRRALARRQIMDANEVIADRAVLPAKLSVP